MIDHDGLWDLFCTLVPGEKERLRFGAALLDQLADKGGERATRSLNYQGGSLINWLTEHDDAIYNEACGFTRATSIPKAVDHLAFQVAHNGMTPERAARLILRLQRDRLPFEDASFIEPARAAILQALGKLDNAGPDSRPST